MATEPTELAKTIGATDHRAIYDTNAKKLIKHRIILAWILKECVPEFKNYEVSYIEKNCFAGEIKMSTVSVDQDRPDANISINGSDTVDTSENEGEIRYDIVFDAVVPKTKKTIRVIINIEIQNKTDLKYSLVTRVIYYGSRLISRQKGTVFKNHNYQNIQKVYSIWICPSPKKKDANSIVKYGIKKKCVIGSPTEEPVKNYDKMDVIIISLNDKVLEIKKGNNNVDVENKNNQTEDDRKIIRLLSALLSKNKSAEERKKIMNDEFSIPMTEEITKEVDVMCNLGYAIETEAYNKGQRKGERKGERKGKINNQLENIRTVMKKMNSTAKEAMDFLDIPEKERKGLLKKLETTT